MATTLFQGATKQYQVPDGSNLSASAKAMGITLQQLLDSNSQYQANPHFVKAGAFLNYPSSNPNNPASAPVTPTRSKYIDPATGKYFQTAQEYGNYVATKIPASKPAGDVPAYAGDAMTNPNQSAVDLQGTARDLNNARNDIAVGATDPYGVGNKSGVAYSPTELKAIENAYAGIYDPALNDVFARLKEKQAADQKAVDDQQYIYRQKLQTDENIRQYKSTTGANDSTKSAIGPIVKSGGLVTPESDVSKGQQFLESRRGDDGMGKGKGYYNSQDYIDMYNEWVVQHNALPSDFFKYFPPNLNPNDPTIPQSLWNMINQYGGNSGAQTH